MPTDKKSSSQAKVNLSESKLLPCSIEAEQAVLGAVIADSQCLSKVTECIENSKFFYKNSHQLVYDSFLELLERGRNIDIITVAEHLKDHAQLTDVGGRAYLLELTEKAPIAANAEYYAQIVQQKALLRNMIIAGNDIVDLGYTTDEDLDILVDKAEQLVFKLAQNKSKDSLLHIGNILSDSWEQLEERAMNQNQLTGVDTGYYDLNAFTSGFQKSDLIILAARPAMGKTSLALNIAENVALNNNQPVAVFSLEMGKEQLVQRLLCGRAEIDSSRVRTGQLREDDWARLSTAMAELGEAPMFIDDSAGVTVMELRGKCRRLQALNGNLGLVVIDYLQLIEGRGNQDNRVSQMSEISRGLKLLARELNVPILALSQLSRAVESRQDKRPMLSDLRESGCLAAHTKIYDPISGEYNEIIDLVGKENFYVSALNPETLKLESVKAKKCFHSGRKKTYRLKTASGNEVEASANHPFLRGHDWIALEDLAVGDYIACNRVVTTPEKKCRVDDQELIVLPNPEDINKLANSDLFWDKIISIEPLDEVDVYDIEVPEFHNFLAENIIVHNSIEQDADMVMMIYRDDYYNPESEKAGMADLIIAKHRSGPVGIVELLFQASITKFKNPVRL